MTRDDIIRMAKNAGCYREDCGFAECDFDAAMRFAALVAAAEREACAKVCDGIDEACFPTSRGPAAKCAQAIRARGES